MSCYKSYGRENRFDPVTFKKEFRGAIHPSKVIVLFCSLSDSLKRTRTSFSKPIKINPKKGNFYFLANIFPVNLFSTCSDLRWVSKLIVLFFSVCCSLIDLAPLSLITMIDRKNVFSIFGAIFRWVSKVIVLFCSLCDLLKDLAAVCLNQSKLKPKTTVTCSRAFFPRLEPASPHCAWHDIWLVYLNVCTYCNWPHWLPWFWVGNYFWILLESVLIILFCFYTFRQNWLVRAATQGRRTPSWRSVFMCFVLSV